MTKIQTAESSVGHSIMNRLRSVGSMGFLYIAFVAMIVVFSVASPVFLSVDNFLNIGRQTALVSIIAVGMTFVIISGQIDLSAGSVMALSGLVSALSMLHLANNWVLGAIVGILTGAVVGLINGVLVGKLLIPSFLVTLGMLGAARGMALLITDTRPVLIDNDDFFTIFAEGQLLGIPMPIVWTLIVLIIGMFLLHRTAFGRAVYATGGNATAARFSGIKVARTTITTFVITGALAGLASLVLSARSHAARPDVGSGLELDVIAAVILGGTSLFGGRGLMVGTLVGSLIIGVLNNGLVLLGVSSSLQLVIKGVIIVLAVALSSKRLAR